MFEVEPHTRKQIMSEAEEMANKETHAIYLGTFETEGEAINSLEEKYSNADNLQFLFLGKHRNIIELSNGNALIGFADLGAVL